MNPDFKLTISDKLKVLRINDMIWDLIKFLLGKRPAPAAVKQLQNRRRHPTRCSWMPCGQNINDQQFCKTTVR